MRILHTSDWHLGKRLEGKSRLDEQKDVLSELIEVVRTRDIDAVVLAGDVYDTVNPPAEAEELFYETALAVGALCPFAVVAGNHDNPERLSAPEGIAGASNIYLLGGMDNTHIRRKNAQGTVGGLRLETKSGRLNIAALPYPSLSRMSGLGYDADGEKTYGQNVADWLEACAQVFGDGVNILVSHLFLSQRTAGDEAELGTAALLSPSVLPRCDYAALGHIHRAQTVSSQHRAYYSGSILGYSFDDAGEKYFYVYDTQSDKPEKIAITSGKKILTAECETFAQAMQILGEHGGEWVCIKYNSPEPLSAKEYGELRAMPNFCKLTLSFTAEKSEAVSRTDKTDKQLFCDFYKKEKGVEVPSDILDMFLAALAGEEF